MSDNLRPSVEPSSSQVDKASDTASANEATGSEPVVIPASAHQPTVSSDHPHGPPPAVAEPGQIGGYTIIRKLGEGGMGAVYLAEDPRLGRKVAIKTMKPEVATSKLDRERFLREARAAAAVENDYIVPILHSGELADGSQFIVMPFLQGEPLDMRLKRESTPNFGIILKVAREVAEGLAAAHAKGLIHRDIKPSNIWLEDDLTSKEPAQQIRRCKILDFGLARSVEKGDAQITASGAILGTPAYMAPEQARGEKLDHRADLFSLGVTLYRMATGQQPFTGPTPMAVIISVATDTPPPVRTLAPTLPPELADLIDHLMSKDPAGRPQSAAEVAKTVRTLIKDFKEKKTTQTVRPVMPAASPPMAPGLALVVPPAGPISQSVPQVVPTVEDSPEPPRVTKPVRVPGKRIRLSWMIAAVVCVLLVMPLGLWWS